MGMFLNSISASRGYADIVKTRFFVDKSPLIAEIISAVDMDGQKYFCITRPRRFGKSIAANMLAAFLGRAKDTKDIFDHLKIAQWDGYTDYLNRYHVIYIDFSRMPENCLNIQGGFWQLESVMTEKQRSIPVK